ncbi:MAG: hypothetical protein Ct9H300mP1_28450 [Planctomycetaceae bacterium]|nr:MAG: hypothetical protein Ct9H300mP1_28450 [Planctomycetaceae bacterium]
MTDSARDHAVPDDLEPSGPPIRVLVVDDDEPHAQAVAESLERVGYECKTAISGEEARHGSKAKISMWSSPT